MDQAEWLLVVDQYGFFDDSYNANILYTLLFNHPSVGTDSFLF